MSSNDSADAGGSCLGDDIYCIQDELSSGQIIWMKIQRTLMAFTNLVLFVLACHNVWNFLYKRAMYKSFPLTIMYSFILIFCLIGFVYNMFMEINCGEHDCFQAFILHDEQIETWEHIKENHLNDVYIIAFFWHVKQQMFLGISLS